MVVGEKREKIDFITSKGSSLPQISQGMSISLLFERGQRQIWLVWAYLGSFFGPEGGPYGHECVVWSTRTPTRKVDMIKTLPRRFQARMTPY